MIPTLVPVFCLEPGAWFVTSLTRLTGSRLTTAEYDGALELGAARDHELEEQRDGVPVLLVTPEGPRIKLLHPDVLVELAERHAAEAA